MGYIKRQNISAIQKWQTCHLGFIIAKNELNVLSFDCIFTHYGVML